MSSKGGHGHKPKGRRPKKHEEEEHENHERWLVSYADMLTLLFALFVVLYALSNVDIKKFTAFADGLSTGFGSSGSVINENSGDSDSDAVIDPLQPLQIVQEEAVSGKTQSDADKQAAADLAKQQAQQTAAEAQESYDELKTAEEKIEKALDDAGESDAATFAITEEGLVVHVVSDPVLFDPESATLLPSGRKVVAAVAPALEKLTNDIHVEGHANKLPVTAGGPWPSNWELSGFRASTVLRQLAKDGVDEDRMAAVGYGSTHPLVPYTDPDAYEKNRRVDIVVLSDASAAANALLPSLAKADEN